MIISNFEYIKEEMETLYTEIIRLTIQTSEFKSAMCEEIVFDLKVLIQTKEERDYIFFMLSYNLFPLILSSRKNLLCRCLKKVLNETFPSLKFFAIDKTESICVTIEDSSNGLQFQTIKQNLKLLIRTP